MIFQMAAPCWSTDLRSQRIERRLLVDPVNHGGPAEIAAQRTRTAFLPLECPLLENDRYPTVQLMPAKTVKNIGLLFSNSMLYSDIVF